MTEFTVNNEDLKKALTLTNSATGSTKNSIESHCLFQPRESSLTIFSTDKSTCISKAVVDIQGSGTESFTADPLKLLNLIKMSKSDAMKFIYHPETTTLEIHASEDEDSFISLPSFDVSLFPSIEDNFDKAYEVKTVDAGILIKGLKFTEGFSATGKNAGKFGNVFFSNGIIYGSNGDNQAGAYSCPEFSGLTDLIFPSAAVSQIVNIIVKLDLMETTIKTTSTVIIVSSKDSKYSFGFTKVNLSMPKIPISTEEPKENGWVLDKKSLLKKISRLQVSGESGMGVEICFSQNKIDLTTKSERPSRESLICVGEEQAQFLADCWLLEKVISLFEGDSLSIHSGKRRIVLFSKGTIDIQETDGTTRPVPFSCSALMALAS